MRKRSSPEITPSISRSMLQRLSKLHYHHHSSNNFLASQDIRLVFTLYVRFQFVELFQTINDRLHPAEHVTSFILKKCEEKLSPF